jgi:RNase H-like domain found in reverse transcriptase/Reverse transcriptase (RNA-dependent DNA polymerase)/Integrase zinc binding domain/Chromo (CHRromatin Organisation MOdifier) domain
MQPKIDWKRGWIDHSQLPIIFRTPDAGKARFTLRTTNAPRPIRTIQIGRLLICATNPSIPIPLQYRTFERVFSEEASHEFPPSRPWDHAIDLKPGAPAALPGKLIPLSQAELEQLRKFVKEHLKRGTIRPSKSPYKARFFYIQKKDGTLRAVQDYRPVNQWTIRNAYPLPLIPELIDRLNGCSLYTKFDIRWGYNNVRIKEGDEWKAAFITNEGLFEPTVMFFGLTNSPATFQTMMNSIFSEEVAERWMTIYMDDMAIHTKRQENETELQHILRHRSYVCRVLTKLQENNLFLKPEKCTFEQPSIEFLGVRVSEGSVHMDDVKVEKVRKWLPPKNVTEVRKFLSFTGYYRYFIKDYSKIAKPLLLLTHNTTPWHWNDEQQKAFEQLRDLMCQQPVLKQPDFTKPFAVFTDASAYGVGAILSQEGGPNTQNRTKYHPVAYYSATFTETERNYDVYDRELLAIMKAITHWRPYLIWMKEPFKIFTDHANLLHWKSPRKLNRRTARWHGELQDYNFTLHHVPGKNHTAADALSRPPGADTGKDDNQQMIMLPEPIFIRVFDADSDGSLEHTITVTQNTYRTLMEEWEGTFPIERVNNPDAPFWRDAKSHRLVIPPDQGLKRELMHSWHNGPLSGHPGRDETIRKINKEYFWPGARAWITEYIKGCATCQQNKNLTHRVKTPPFHIPSVINAKPFSHIAMDLITGLPKSNNFDAILTIVDHGCSRGAIFLPCTTTITGAGIAKLYLENVFRWFGLPRKIISDRDPRFTSHFGKAITQALGITQNLSTAFHPQTDGLSERKNQWIEQYLRLICTNQDDWARWLPMATAVHNNTRNATTGFSPNTLLLGWEPPLSPDQIVPTSNQKTEDYVTKFQKNRLMAILALNKAASAHTPLSSKYSQGQRVWLEGKNLPLSHGTVKLSPKRYGPFIITKLISPVASQLDLPASWNIHPVFHNNLLTPYVETNAHGPNFTRPPPDLINGEAEYEVEAIKSHRYFGKNKRLQYLLKWKGYPEADNTWESEDQLNAPELLKQYNRCHNLPHKKTRARLAETHPLPSTQSWSSTLTPISLTTSTPTSPSSTTECPLSTSPMSLPPPLRRPRPSSLSRSTPSSIRRPSPSSPQIIPPYRRRLRSTSSLPNPTSTRRSARLLTASSPPSTAAKSPTPLRPRSVMKPTAPSRRSSRLMRTRSTGTSSSPAARMATSPTTGVSPPSSPTPEGSSYLPSSSDSETMVESYCYPGRNKTKNRTPLTSTSCQITHLRTSPSHSPVGSRACFAGQPLPSTPFAAPSPTSTTGTPPPNWSAIGDKTTASDTSATNSCSYKPRFTLSRTTWQPRATASKPPASRPAFRIWKEERGPRITPHADAPWGEGLVEDQEVQTRAGGDDTVVYPRLRVIRTNWA